MKRVFVHLLLFLLPFLLNIAIVYVVDPYNLIHEGKYISDEAKYKCIRRTAATIPRGQVPWKMAMYDRNPIPNVVFGDSRMTHLNGDYFTQNTGEELFNFAIAGGNLRTSIDFFWFCTTKTSLKRVFFQVGFINFNDKVYYDIVAPYWKFSSNLLTYFTNQNVCIDTYSVLYYLATDNEDFVNIDYHERSINLWQRGYDLIDLRMNDFVYPSNYLNEYRKIVNYCKENGIEIYFIHIPNHRSFIDKIREYDKEKEYQAYFEDLKSLSPLINPTSLFNFTQTDENYKDVFHFKTEFADSISNEIWKQYIHLYFQPPLAQQTGQ